MHERELNASDVASHGSGVEARNSISSNSLARHDSVVKRAHAWGAAAPIRTCWPTKR